MDNRISGLASTANLYDANSGPPRTIAIDLTRLMPGGVSGGVKVVSVELVQQLAEQAPDWKFLVLTSEKSHEELGVVQRSNVRLVCLDSANHDGSAQVWRKWLLPTESFRDLLRHRRLAYVRCLAWRFFWQPRRLRLLEDEQVDALLLPLTTPTFYAPGVPTVAVVYDLQHVDHPEFFRVDERTARNRHLATLSKSAAKLICISNHARDSVLRCLRVSPRHAITIPFGLRSEFLSERDADAAVTLQNYGLQERGFWFYPANSWPHKNHLRLFAAFAEYRRHSRSTVKLVCCGADTGRHDALRRAIAEQHLEGVVRLIGYVPKGDLLNLMASCRGVIFPSLYEGFGMPVLEAMACGVPVACSNVTSLPEVAGDAAILFDPTRTESIAAALQKLDDPDIATTLATAGRKRAANFDTAGIMARRYLKVLDDVCRTDLSITAAG